MKPVVDSPNASIRTVIEALEIGQELFWEPTRLVSPSPWVGHLSVAFWLVQRVRPRILVELGTHSGNSYSAFCQSIAESGLAARAYAVDTWKGDEQSGAYGEEVFVDLHNFNQQHYGSFSTLLRTEFDKARAQFADGSIDLLHIDGLHTYDAIRHDFETWCDAVSKRGVIVFHDTNVREQDFGVWRFWAELAGQYPSYEFDHSNGLGILGFGDEQPEALRRLFQFGQDSGLKAIVGRLFAARGSLFQARLRASEMETDIARLRGRLEVDAAGQRDGLNPELDTLRASLTSSDRAIKERDQAIVQLREHLGPFDETIQERDWANERYVERLRQCESDLQSLNDTKAERDEIIQAQTLLLDRRSARTNQLEQKIHQLKQELQHLKQEIQRERTTGEAVRTSLVSLYENSTSWRVTAPIRLASVASRSALRRLKRSAQPSDAANADVEAVTSHNASKTEVHSLSVSSTEQGKRAMRAHLSSRLRAFLATSGMLRLPSSETPDVTIILILYNQAELTFGCLTSIAECLYGSDLSVDVVILDNHSTDETARDLLTRVSGAHVIRSPENVHFLRGVNRAAAESKGRYLLLLNSDAQLLPGTLESAVRTLESASDIGGVGGRIILPDGTLQEAGSIIWNDGSCSGYGQGAQPTAPEFMFRRDVDYCSGAFLLTPRTTFERLGGFDERYAPAYYEEVDYCVRLWQSGLRIVFDPDAVVLHYEFGSSSSEPAMELQQRNWKVFRERYVEWLSHKAPRSSANVLTARAESSAAKRVLVIEDRVPHEALGTGYPRTRLMLRDLVAEGAQVSFFPMLGPPESWSDVRRSVDPSIEVIVNGSHTRLRDFLLSRQGYYHGIIVCRPHNMRWFLEAVGSERHLIDGATILYDGEAIFARRERLKGKAIGSAMTVADVGRLYADEIQLTESADAVISVSEAERRLFQDLGVGPTLVLGHAIDLDPANTPFEAREGLLFVGSIQSDDSPNADSLRWFAREVLPLLRSELGEDMLPTVVGLNRAASIEALDGTAYRLMGIVDDLKPWFERARVFFAPTRYAAGIPIKIYQAAAFGVPVVATKLIAAHAGWQADRDLLAASDAVGFAKACARLYRDEVLWNSLRIAALDRCREDCSPQTFREGVRQILSTIPSPKSRRW